MKKSILTTTLSAMFLLFSVQIHAEEQKIEKKFSSKSTISISTISGNCMIYKGETNEIIVSLNYTYPSKCFDYSIDEKSNAIKISERFSGSCSGESEWVITVPQTTKVDVNTVSGDVLVVGINAEVNVNTVSGDITLQSIIAERVVAKTASGDLELSKVSSELSFTTASGDININGASGEYRISSASGGFEAKDFNGNLSLSTASGDVDLISSTGSFSLKTASGDINAETVILSGESEFSTASGDVKVSLKKSPDNDLKLATASGDVILDYNGNALNGNFEFTAKVDKGKIVSPVGFDKEEVITKNGDEYDVKSFTIGNSSPEIKLKTASGSVKLVK